MSLRRFDELIGCLRQRVAAFHDRRTGENSKYTMEDIGLSAFSVFYTPCPSFLANPKAMQQNKGQSNAQTLFQIKPIPTDNPVRDTLDAVPPTELFPVYDEIYEALREQGVLASFRGIADTTPIALDGTWYFSSGKLHCPQCSRIEHASGQITYYPSAITSSSSVNPTPILTSISGLACWRRGGTSIRSRSGCITRATGKPTPSAMPIRFRWRKGLTP